MPADPTIFMEQKALTYSHAPPSASLDISDRTATPDIPGVIPYHVGPDDADPLYGFLAQNVHGVAMTEAERIGADRYGMSWPMIRAQRAHCGDTHYSEAMARRIYSHSRTGVIFTPLEVPQNPAYLYKPSGKRR